jgi:hypothetical protein
MRTTSLFPEPLLVFGSGENGLFLQHSGAILHVLFLFIHVVRLFVDTTVTFFRSGRCSVFILAPCEVGLRASSSAASTRGPAMTSAFPLTALRRGRVRGRRATARDTATPPVSVSSSSSRAVSAVSGARRPERACGRHEKGRSKGHVTQCCSSSDQHILAPWYSLCGESWISREISCWRS